MNVIKLKKTNNTLILFIITITISFLLIEKTHESQITHLNEKSCTFKFEDNTSVDLSPLRRETDFTFPVGRYIYKGNFCGPQKDKCGGLQLAGSIYIRRKNI